MSDTIPFKRTTCACDNCVACCKQQPGCLVPSDIARIKEFLGEPLEKYFVASRGSLIKDMRTGIAERVGTITPDYVKGRCVFLDENDRCKIHPVAPFGCSYVDTHMNRSQGMERSLYIVHEVRGNAEYKAVRDKLPLAKHYKPFKY